MTQTASRLNSDRLRRRASCRDGFVNFSIADTCAMHEAFDWFRALAKFPCGNFAQSIPLWPTGLPAAELKFRAPPIHNRIPWRLDPAASCQFAS
jgi:hypothetical protein